MTWCQKGAAQNNSDAQNMLGIIYRDGFGVSRDYEQAAVWFRKAAAQDNEGAQTNLQALQQTRRTFTEGWQAKHNQALRFKCILEGAPPDDEDEQANARFQACAHRNLKRLGLE
jgi:TPR repeat protein